MALFLDTNICAYIMNGKYPYITTHYLECDGNVKIPSVVLFELRYGAEKSRQYERNIAKIQKFISKIEVVPFDAQAAELAGKIRADLERKGQVIGGNDILIAAVALANGATLVTNNTREFERVDGLRIENCVQEDK